MAALQNCWKQEDNGCSNVLRTMPGCGDAQRENKYLSTTTIAIHTVLPTRWYPQDQHREWPHKAGHLETLLQ